MKLPTNKVLTIPPVPTSNRDVPSETLIDPINRLADVSMGMNSKPSAQTLMVRPVSTTILTFDGKSEKFELFLRSFSHNDKDATRHDGNNENQAFSLFATQKRSTDIP